MPSVDVAMVESLRQPMLASRHLGLAAGRGLDLAPRDLLSDAQGQVSNVRTAFSSWDNCMNASYCKWPVIALIIIGSLIVVSIIWCIARCACCGRACCCSCFQCCKCCGNCCGCFDPPGTRRRKYLDEPFIPPHQGYQSQDPMHSPFSSKAPGQASMAPPQYAEFDVSKKKTGEDSLPEMPSWEAAGSKRVMVDEEALEMDALNKPPSASPGPLRSASPAAGTPTPFGPASMSPFDQPRASLSAFALQGARPATGSRNASPLPPRERRFNDNPADNGFGLDQPYDHWSPNATSPYGELPAQANSPQSAAPSHQENEPLVAPRNPFGLRNMSREYIEMPAEPVRPGGYDDLNPPNRSQPSTPQPTYPNQPAYPTTQRPPRSLGPRPDGFVPPSSSSSPGPRHQEYTPFGYDSSRVGATAPGRQATPDRRHPPEMEPKANLPFAQSPPQSPITNNSGFDFTSGYSRPKTSEGQSANPRQYPSQAMDSALYTSYRPGP